MLWDEVLTALGQSQGYVSGAELSRRFGVTRAGIHVTVERLREAGYEIVSARKRGYRLLGGPDSLGIGDLAMHLPKERLAAVRCLKEVDSTNRYLKELAEEKLPEGREVFYIYTSSMTKESALKQIRAAASAKGNRELGAYHCKGFDTFGPFKLVGGVGKGHPNEAEIRGAVEFYEGL